MRLISYTDDDRRTVSRTHMFTGEVLSGLLQPYLMGGFISPRLLVHARSLALATLCQENDSKWWDMPPSRLITVSRPLECRMTMEAIRKDWQFRVAQHTLQTENDKRYDRVEYTFNGNGYIQRSGIMRHSSNIGNAARSDMDETEAKAKENKGPLYVLIHGFGGSMDQMSGLGRSLMERQPQAEVFAVDLLGFGRSEKAPLSYNQ